MIGQGLLIPNEIRTNYSAFSFLIDGKVGYLDFDDFKFKLINLILFQGYLLEYSLLFIGYYDSGQNEPYVGPPANPKPYIGRGYKLPVAYLTVVFIIYGFSGNLMLLR